MNPNAPGGSKRRVILANSPSLPWQASLPQGRALFVPLVPFVGLPADTVLTRFQSHPGRPGPRAVSARSGSNPAPTVEFVPERLRGHVLRPGTGRGPTLSRPPRARSSARFLERTAPSAQPARNPR